jgi:hypothetical protein
MLARDDAFQEIMKIALLPFSIFPRKYLFSLLTSQTNTNFKKWKQKMFSQSKSVRILVFHSQLSLLHNVITLIYSSTKKKKLFDMHSYLLLDASQYFNHEMRMMVSVPFNCRFSSGQSLQEHKMTWRKWPRWHMPK